VQRGIARPGPGSVSTVKPGAGTFGEDEMWDIVAAFVIGLAIGAVLGTHLGVILMCLLIMAGDNGRAAPVSHPG
jgi:hypothetical protein